MPERLRTYFRLFSDQPPLFRALCLARGQRREPAMHWAKDWNYRGAWTHSFGRILRQEVQGVSMHRIKRDQYHVAPDVAASSPLIPFSHAQLGLKSFACPW